MFNANIREIYIVQRIVIVQKILANGHKKYNLK